MSVLGNKAFFIREAKRHFQMAREVKDAHLKELYERWHWQELILAYEPERALYDKWLNV